MGSTDKFRVRHNVFDAFTERGLFKMSSQGFFEELVSPISMGKEANVFSARKGREFVAVKIYRLENCNFNAMWSYLGADPRFKNIKPRKRQIIFAWVQREFHNLLKAREAGVRVPTPIHFANNIVVEEFIGQDNQASPQLNKTEVDYPDMFKRIIEQMKLMYKGGLVHADLSAFNILVDDDKPVFIDMSQTTSVEDTHAKEYLTRDIKNICAYFSRYGVEADVDDVLENILKS